MLVRIVFSFTCSSGAVSPSLSGTPPAQDDASHPSSSQPPAHTGHTQALSPQHRDSLSLPPSLLPSSPLTATHKHCHHNTETPFPSLPPPLLSPHCYTQALSPLHRDSLSLPPSPSPLPSLLHTSTVTTTQRLRFPPSLPLSSPLTATHKHCYHNTETPFPSLPPPLLSPHCYTQALSPQHRDKGLAATHTTCTLRIYNIYIYIYMIVHCTLPLPTSS